MAMLILRGDGERNLSSELADPPLPRKTSSEKAGARTENRHRWVRRES